MLKDLIKLANELDSKGLVKQADLLDKAINKRAAWDDHYGQPEDYRADTAEMMMEDFNKRLSHDEQDKFVQMFARVIDSWEETKKSRPEETQEVEKKEYVTKIYSPEEFREMSDDELIESYDDLPDGERDVNIDFYKELARRDKGGYVFDSKNDIRLIVNPEDMSSSHSNTEMFIIRDLIMYQNLDKSYLQELYNKA